LAPLCSGSAHPSIARLCPVGVSKVEFEGIFDQAKAEGIVYPRTCSSSAGAKATIETRITKLIMVASLSMFALLVTFDNLTDYDTNYAFVWHVLNMDTTLPGERAALSPHHLARIMAGRLRADHRGRGAVRRSLGGRNYFTCPAPAL
jgi:Predicted small integral membrane protein (DUF2165)